MDIITPNSPKNQYGIINADILEWAETYEGPLFHAALLDPPYHLTITKRFGKPGSKPAKVGVYNRASKGFMNQSWDGTGDSGLGIAFRPETWAALSQHLHPGGFILAFAGTRGYHRMACAMEDSGLIIHPAMVWTFLSGFCKATRIDTQIDRAAGVEREIIGRRDVGPDITGDNFHRDDGQRRIADITAPATPLAQTWAGHRYGLQALKPALEFIAVAQKPYVGRPVDCITRTGAGAWNIEAGRIPGQPEATRFDPSKHNHEGWRMDATGAECADRADEVSGRWPANLLLDEAGAALLDRQSGEVRAAYGNEESAVKNAGKDVNPGIFGGNKSGLSYTDSGGASRMFFKSDWSYEILEQLANADPLKYEPKVSTAEGNVGAEAFYWAITPKGFERVEYEEWQSLDPKKRAEGNIHPTKKPISLCKYLCELISPPDAYAARRICVPFAGSGSEMIGAILSGGFEEVVGIDSNPDYHAIAEARLAWWSQWPGWGQTDVDKILASLGEDVPPEQLSLFQEAAL